MGVQGQRGGQLQVLVDPVSLAVLATRQTSAVYRWVHLLHEHLLMPGYSGRSIIGCCGIGLFLLGLSGVVLWWPAAGLPRRWVAAITVRKKARGARLQRELHGAAGFWFSAMLVIMSASGVTLAFPQTAREVLGLPVQGSPGPGAASAQRGEGRGPRDAGPRGAVHEDLDMDAVLARAAQAVPGAQIVDVRLPNQPGRPVLIRMERDGALAGSPPVVVTIDPVGGNVISLQDPRTQPMGAVLLAWLRALHFGEAFGFPWRVLVFLTGLALPTLAVTGVTLWLLRRRNRLRLQSQRQVAIHGAAE